MSETMAETIARYRKTPQYEELRRVFNTLFTDPTPAEQRERAKIWDSLKHHEAIRGYWSERS